MELRKAHALVAAVRTGEQTIAHVDDLNAALALALDSVQNPLNIYKPEALPMQRLALLMRAHEAVVLTATRAFYVSFTDAMLEVEAVLAKLIRSQVKFASNQSRRDAVRYAALVQPLEAAVRSAGFVVSREFATVLDRTGGVEVSR